MSPATVPDARPAATPAGAPSRRGMARAAGFVSIGLLLSRLLGVVREQLFAKLFGTTVVADAFIAAFRVPNLLRDLFSEGALSAAFVPVFAGELRRSREDAFRFANRLATTSALLLAALVALGLAAGEPLLALVAPGFAASPGKLRLATVLARVIFPVVPLVALAATAMGALNALHRFFVPAFASACFNVVAVAAGVALWFSGLGPRAAALGWAAATLAGGVAQAVVQLPTLWRLGWRPRALFDPLFRDPAMRRTLRLVGPGIVGLAGTQVNVLVNTVFASARPGAVSWLNFAFPLVQLPLGLFGVALGTVATAALAHAAAARDVPAMRQTLAHALRLVLFLTVPATVGLVVLARPVVRLIYQHGRFTAEDTAATAAAVAMYALGLCAFSAVRVLAPAFYPVGRTGIAFAGAAASVAANVVLGALLFPAFGHVGLALATALAGAVNLLVLGAGFARLFGGIGGRSLWTGALRIALASFPTGLVAWASWRALEATAFGGPLAAALVPAAAGALAYVLACRALRVPELADVLALVRSGPNPAPNSAT